MSIARILVIAGSDSGGGAGIQADIKTITMLGGHAMTAITAITAQNTLGVSAVQVLSAKMVIAQIDAVVGDLGVDAVKIGMIGSAEIANRVADWLETTVDLPIVLDPVMVATSGAILADDATIDAIARLATLATLVTPNLPELAVLAKVRSLKDSAAIAAAALALVRASAAAVLVKGGHATDASIVDRLFDAYGEATAWRGERIATHHNHGTGCTLASGIATGLAQRMTLPDAIGRARDYVRAALTAAPGIGGGHGPMGHALGMVPFDRLRQDR